jgi:hypothetical protein
MMRIGASNTWVITNVMRHDSTAGSFGSAVKTLSDVLTQFRVTRTTTAAFNAGSLAVTYWRVP